MTTQPTSAATPIRRVRVPDDLWQRFDDAVRAADPEADRSVVLRQFMRWYVGEPGAKIPDRSARSRKEQNHG